MAKRKKILEVPPGLYSAFPHTVLDSEAFKGASHIARSLLCELLRQLNGRNNGHLQLTFSWLSKRGWKSADVVYRAKLELIKRGLIIQTRQGGLNAGANLYAVTWLNISNFNGLDITSKNYYPGKWRFMDPSPVIGKQKLCSVSRNSTDPSDGIVDPLTYPSHGSKTAHSNTSTDPSDGNNEYIPLPTNKTFKPIIGKKGKSGISKIYSASQNEKSEEKDNALYQKPTLLSK